MNRLGIRTLSLAMLTFGGIWASCSVYNEGLLVKTEAGLGGSAGSGGGSGGGDANCNHATFPPPPQGTGLGGSIEIRTAMQTIDFGEVIPLVPGYDTPRPIGYDLDLTCGKSCGDPQWPLDPTAQDDGIDGRDDALGKLIGKIESTWVKNFGSQSYNTQISKGLVSVLFHVKDYNGEPDDDQVTAILYQPAPMLDTLQVDGRTTPQWDGQDTWPVASDSLINSDFTQPAFVDSTAYVTNHVVVATMSSALLRVSAGISPAITVEMNLHFVHAYYTAELVDGPNGWEMHNGQIVGRWPVQDLLSQLSHFPDPNDATLATPLCVNPYTYPNFRSAVCSFVDIVQEPNLTPKCDSISVGIGFTALPALFGDVWELQPLTSRCPPATDPANDACDKPLPTFDSSSAGGSGGTSTGDSSIDRSSTGGTGGTSGTSGSGGQSSGGTGGATDASGQ